MPGLPPLFKSLYPSSAESKRDAWNAALRSPQLYYYNHLMEDIREAIEEGRYARFKKETLAKMEEKED